MRKQVQKGSVTSPRTHDSFILAKQRLESNVLDFYFPALTCWARLTGKQSPPCWISPLRLWCCLCDPPFVAVATHVGVLMITLMLVHWILTFFWAPIVKLMLTVVPPNLFSCHRLDNICKSTPGDTGENKEGFNLYGFVIELTRLI